MRILVFLLIFAFALDNKIYPQLNESDVIVYDYIQEAAIFPGGLDSIWCFLESNLNYDRLNSSNIPVTYYVKFMIDTLGIAGNFAILGSRPKERIFDHTDSLKIHEIYRVMEMMPKWEPAKQVGKKVRCWYVIPIMTPYSEFKCKTKNKKCRVGKGDLHPQTSHRTVLEPLDSYGSSKERDKGRKPYSQ